MSSQSKAICVLGSGRCGTSMVTRSINLIGVELGLNFFPTDSTNPKGYWENREIVMLHKKFLDSVGNNINQPQWWHRNEFRHIKQELKEFVASHFSNKELWGWKDPRTCQFIELWSEILKELNVFTHFLIMVRNPVDVAASFKRAYNADQKVAMAIWQRATLLALKKTDGESRIIFDYNQVLDNSLDCLRAISNTFDLPMPQDENKLKNELNKFVDLKLQHSRTSIENLMNNASIEDEIKELYQLCVKACNSREILNTEYFKNQVENLYQSYFKEGKK
ncbi:sulfotransferase family protein [Ectobacillus funiculus]|uniref:Sulfotransferase family protein n=1 Tax=Ectobacillus funiculus TaxID=137993 RepID=A0ABV5WCF3_9BACI